MYIYIYIYIYVYRGLRAAILLGFVLFSSLRHVCFGGLTSWLSIGSLGVLLGVMGPSLGFRV